MVVSAHDRDAIIDVLNLHGHLMDDGALDELDRLFTEDVVYDLEGLGGGQLSGIRAIRDAALALGDRNPVAHHVSNIVLVPLGERVVRARSKAFGVKQDGTIASVTYDDTLRLTESGWRIEHRRVTPRRRPLGEE